MLLIMSSAKLKVRHTLERKKPFGVFSFSNGNLLRNKQLDDYLRKSKKRFS